MEELGLGDPSRLGPWKLVGRLGAGGMGTVYLGRNNERIAAIKAVSRALVDSPDFRARFRREVDVCRRVTGAQVAELYDADPDAAQPWLAVRYVPGPTLDHAIQEHGPLRGSTLAGFALATAEALRQIHSAGVTHRDLKPSNVILTAETPVIIDFGIAGVADATALTASGTSMGSAGWMSPEQILGNPTGPASDVFSWGALIAYASTGNPPFGTGRPESLAYRVVHGNPDLGGVPSEYRGLVAAALQVEPTARPSVQEIERHLGGDPTAVDIADTIAATWAGNDATRLAETAFTPTVPPPAPTSKRRWHAPAFITAVVLVLAVAGLALYFGTKSPGQEEIATAETTTTDGATTTQSPATTASTTTTEAPTTTAAAITTTTEDRFPTTLADDGRAVEIPLGHARVGDCLSAGLSLPPAVSEYVVRTPCGLEHDLEVISHAALEFPQSTYPGLDAIFEVVEPACQQSFEAYVGAPLGVEFISLTYAVPMDDEWAGGFSEGICLLMGTEGEPLTGSKEDLRG